MGRRTLVTGGTGFVGANLVRRLLALGDEVHLLVRPGYQAWRIDDIRSHLTLHEVVMADAASVSRAVEMARPSWIFHAAASGAYSWQTDRGAMLRTNIEGTINLFEACRAHGFEAFISTGSSSEYGFKATAPTENDLIEPNSDYAVTKAFASQWLQMMGRKHDLNVATLRLYSVYGAYEEPKRLIPTILMHGFHRKLPQLVDPSIARDYVHVDDVSDACVLVAGQQKLRGEIFNVGTAVQTSLAEVVALARRYFSIEAEPQWGSMASRQWDTSTWVSDNRKLLGLGWRPRYAFADGFAQFATWLNESPLRESVYRRP